MNVAAERSFRCKCEPPRQFVDRQHAIEAKQSYQLGAMIGVDAAVDLHGGRIRMNGLPVAACRARCAWRRGCR